MVEWSKDLYTNPHAKISAGLKVSESVTDLNSSNLNLDSMEAEVNNLDDPSQYEAVKQHKLVLEDGIRLFNQKPNKGMKYFQVILRN
jgi:hypothetical protein